MARLKPDTYCLDMTRGWNVKATVDGITATVIFYEAAEYASNANAVAPENFPAIGDRYIGDDTESFGYNLLLQTSTVEQLEGHPDKYKWTLEYSTKPIDAAEYDTGGEFISVKGSTSGFKWSSDGAAISQNMHLLSTVIKCTVIRRRTQLDFAALTTAVGCVSTTDVDIEGRTYPGTDDGDKPDDAYVLFEGFKAAKTSNADGKIQWRVEYRLAIRINHDPTTGTTSGWNNIFRDSATTPVFEVTTPALYSGYDLASILADEVDQPA